MNIIRSTLAEVLQGLVVERLEVSIVAKHCQCIELLLGVAPRRDSGGAVIGAIGIGQDAT